MPGAVTRNAAPVINRVRTTRAGLNRELVWLWALCCYLLSSVAGAEIYFVHNDHRGAPIAMTDVNKNVVWRAEYDPFGKARVTVQSKVMNLRLPGQYFDAETGLHYNYYRDYDPATGRYLQADPIGLEGGVNPFAYVNNNPLTYVDPLGLTQKDVQAAIDIARRTQNDLNFPPNNRYPIRDLSPRGDDVVGFTIPGIGTMLDDRYLKRLSDSEACELLDTVIHEGIHYTLPLKDPRQDDGPDSGNTYPYDEAARRLTPVLKREMNRERRR